MLREAFPGALRGATDPGRLEPGRNDPQVQRNQVFRTRFRPIMIKTLLLASALGIVASATQAQVVIAQFGPTTPYSTLSCPNFAKLPDGSWRARNATRFGLGFVQNIIPPVRPIRSGGYVYNNIDLYSQLELQCVGVGVGVGGIIAKY